MENSPRYIVPTNVLETNEEYLQRIGANIKHYRLEADLRQSDLAILAGTTRQSILAIEKGTRDVSISLMRRVKQALNLHPLIEYEDWRSQFD